MTMIPTATVVAREDRRNMDDASRGDGDRTTTGAVEVPDAPPVDPSATGSDGGSDDGSDDGGAQGSPGRPPDAAPGEVPQEQARVHPPEDVARPRRYVPGMVEDSGIWVWFWVIGGIVLVAIIIIVVMALPSRKGLAPTRPVAPPVSATMTAPTHPAGVAPGPGPGTGGVAPPGS
jgi:hypothetical protein